ncbi:hypothetical protein J2T12_004927 [Paenibacillus anaericanus]|uniref:hypothetical protein n=1 Tax=Paenibacillus anaericanus TaxID=170367 RepID=UPI0027858ACF|nr:hypothetical protein [Paenibacillus anaericanus]MDQ0091490.1 hypothetical protein [Paenibacillus anaericanus]
MTYTFIIQPSTYNAFENEAELIEKCKEWGLLSDKAAKMKAFFYKGNGMNLACTIVGFVDNVTAVIEFDNKQQHCIHPSYLKEMQAANYGSKPSVSADEEEPQIEPTKVDTPEAAELKAEQPTVKEPKAKELIVDISEASEPPKSKVKKEKKQKLQLPEEKVKLSAIVKEFTTVPNHFSDNDDEVVIYEAVTIIEPETEIGEAWSSHSATLKKNELAIGDKITFEAKIVAKKLTKYPVPYKINNPAKIQKVDS